MAVSKRTALKANGQLKKGYRYGKGGRIIAAKCKAKRAGTACSARGRRKRR